VLEEVAVALLRRDPAHVLNLPPLGAVVEVYLRLQQLVVLAQVLLEACLPECCIATAFRNSPLNLLDVEGLAAYAVAG
jgi:hypothetical protein